MFGATPLVATSAGAQETPLLRCSTTAQVFDVNQAGELRRYPHRDPVNGADSWEVSHYLGDGFLGRTLAGPAGKIHELEADGLLRNYELRGGAWIRYGEDQAYSRDIQTDWADYTTEDRRHKITVDAEGDIYLIQDDGQLVRATVNVDASALRTEVIDTGWDRYDLIVAAGDGVIYGRTPDGTLYRNHYNFGGQRWLELGVEVGTGWERYSRITSTGADVLYGTDRSSGHLRWHRFVPHSGEMVEDRTVSTEGHWAEGLDTSIRSDTCDWSFTPRPNRPGVTQDPDGRPVLFESADSHVQIAALTPEGELQHGRMSDPLLPDRVSWSTFPSTVKFRGSPAIGQSLGDSRLLIAAHDRHSEIWSSREIFRLQGWIPLEPEGGFMVAAPSLLQGPDGTMVAFAVDEDGGLWTADQMGAGHLGGWRQLAGTPALAPEPPTVISTESELHFVVRTETGELVENRLQGGGWVDTTWQSLDLTADHPAAAVLRADGTVAIAAVHEGAVHLRETGQGWSVLDGVTATGPAAMAESVWGTLELLVRGSDGYLFATGEVESDSVELRPWETVSLQPSATDPALISSDTGRLIGAYRSTESIMHILYRRPPEVRTTSVVGQDAEFVDVPVNNPHNG
ncbi:tachylectin-related carbohydrate-binding protein [Actinoalloteichus hymeniacidonis]|nr:tachylectin-related carbohydrate-binding protein [Actinoalloteichus hymeniacidonis]MBB5907255.1 hypothetical protein [Actinoalloteichus hymeniacidonis]